MTLRCPAPCRDHIRSQTQHNEPVQDHTIWKKGSDRNASVRTTLHPVLPFHRLGSQSCTRHSYPNSRVIAGIFSHETDSVTMQSRTCPHEGKRIGPMWAINNTIADKSVSCEMPFANHIACQRLRSVPIILASNGAIISRCPLSQSARFSKTKD